MWKNQRTKFHSAVEESIASEEINVVSTLGDTQESVQDSQSADDELSQPKENGHADNEEQANFNVNVPEIIDSKKDANVSSPLVGVTREVTEYSDTSVSVRITNDTNKGIQCDFKGRAKSIYFLPALCDLGTFLNYKFCVLCTL